MKSNTLSKIELAQLCDLNFLALCLGTRDADVGVRDESWDGLRELSVMFASSGAAESRAKCTRTLDQSTISG